MLTELLAGFMPELTAIDARTFNIVRKSTGTMFNEEKYHPNRVNLLWLPGMCLLAAKAAKNTNARVVRLAGILHMLGLASHLHWSLAEDTELAKMKQEIQYPILVGDLLYSRVYTDICRYRLQQYLMPLTSLVGSIHEELMLKDTENRRDLSDRSHEIKIYAMMSESACYLGAHAAAGDTFATDILREIGYHLGLLRGVAERGANISRYLSDWYACWELSEGLPDEKTRQQYQHILLYLGRRWGLRRPALLCS